MTRYKTLIFLLLAGLTSGKCAAQIAVNFSPVVYGHTLDGLAYARIVNTSSSDLMAKLTIRVRESRQGNVLTISLPSFLLNAGVNELNRVAFANARFSFGNNNLGLTVSQTGRFPEGEYEYCYEVDISESKVVLLTPVFENCFIQEVQPRTPMLLISPIDGDVFCNKRPQFIWQPPMPMPADSRFRLVLTNVREKQDIVEAVTFNPPLLNQNNISGNTLIYPANAPELVEGERYAWQVVLYHGLTIISRSEVWTFVHQCREERKDTLAESYRELNDSPDGSFYFANRYLRFSFVNPYSAGDLNYSIQSLNNPSEEIKSLPALKMRSGLNKYDLNLSENRAFRVDEEYVLKVRLPNNKILSLRFVYKNE